MCFCYVKEGIESEGVNEEIRVKTKAQLDFLKKEGHVVEPINLSYLDYILPTPNANDNPIAYSAVVNRRLDILERIESPTNKSPPVTSLKKIQPIRLYLQTFFLEFVFIKSLQTFRKI